MNKYTTLENELVSRGVKMHSICINETPQDGSFCIHNYGDKIEVFFFERGMKFDLEIFQSDDEAIECFKKMVV